MWRFVHSGDFFDQVIRTRNIWLAGRLGSGKTALSVMMACELIRLGTCRYCWSNFPVLTRYLPPPPDGFLEHSVVIIDEAHSLINARDFQSNSRDFGAFGRKFNNVWLYPSVDSIDKRVRTIRVQRAFRLDFLPVHVWIYRYAMSYGEEHDLGWFAVYGADGVFGWYDHYFIPFDDSGILDSFRRTMERKAIVQGGGWDPFLAGEWGK